VHKTYFLRKPYLYSLDLYDWETKKLARRIDFKKEGPDGIGSGKPGVYIHSIDSIFVANGFKLFLVDSVGQVRDKYEILDVEALGELPDLQINTINPLLLSNDRVVVSVYPHRNAFNKDHLKKWQNFATIDLRSQVVNTFGSLPGQMQSNLYGYNYLDKSYIFDENENIWITFAPLKNIYKINLAKRDQLQEQVIRDGTSFEDAPPLPGNTSQDFMVYTKHYLLNDSYDAIYYNSKRRIFLRIVQPKITMEELNKRKWAKKKILQFFDANWNLIYEWNTNSKRVDFSMVVPTADGFLIRTDYNTENKLAFLNIKLYEK